MNLKDRLEYIKQTNTISIKDNDSQGSYPGITDVFADSVDVRNLILNLIHENKNIIFAGDKSIDKLMAAVYFQSLIGENNSEIINSIDENISNRNFQKNIVPNPDIYNIVRIFEYIIYGYKSFIFGLDLNNSDNFLDKLKTLIALNFKNLTDSNINTLIGSSDSVFVFISKNDDGLYFISEINKINYLQGELSFENIFSYILNNNAEDVTCDNVSLKPEDEIFEIEIESDEGETDNSDDQNIDTKNETETTSEESSTAKSEESLTEEVEIEEIQAEEVPNEEVPNEEAQIEEAQNDETQIDETQIDETSAKKINKYKLLKEKIKNKKNIL